MIITLAMDDNVLLDIRTLVCERLHPIIPACNVYPVLTSCNTHALSPHRLDSRLATRRIPTRHRRPPSRVSKHPSANRHSQGFTKIPSIRHKLQESFPQFHPSSSSRTLGPHIRYLLRKRKQSKSTHVRVQTLEVCPP